MSKIEYEIGKFVCGYKIVDLLENVIEQETVYFSDYF